MKGFYINPDRSERVFYNESDYPAYIKKERCPLFRIIRQKAIGTMILNLY